MHRLIRKMAVVCDEHRRLGYEARLSLTAATSSPRTQLWWRIATTTRSSCWVHRGSPGDGSPAGFQLIRNKTANLRPRRKATDAAVLRRSVAAVSQVAIDRASRAG